MLSNPCSHCLTLQPPTPVCPARTVLLHTDLLTRQVCPCARVPVLCPCCAHCGHPFLSSSQSTLISVTHKRAEGRGVVPSYKGVNVHVVVGVGGWLLVLLGNKAEAAFFCSFVARNPFVLCAHMRKGEGRRERGGERIPLDRCYYEKTKKGWVLTLCSVLDDGGRLFLVLAWVLRIGQRP